MTQGGFQPTERISEIEFRARMPRTIGGRTIVFADGYRPGGDGWYASMIVVSVWGVGKDDLATHRLVWQHDRAETEPTFEWIFEQGHYGFSDFQRARKDAAERIAQDAGAVPAPAMIGFTIGLDASDKAAPYVALRTSEIGRGGTPTQASRLLLQYQEGIG